MYQNISGLGLEFSDITGAVNQGMAIRQQAIDIRNQIRPKKPAPTAAIQPLPVAPAAAAPRPGPVAKAPASKTKTILVLLAVAGLGVGGAMLLRRRSRRR